MIGTAFTNEDNNDDIEHLKSTLKNAELNSISDFGRKIKVEGLQINLLIGSTLWSAPKKKKKKIQPEKNSIYFSKMNF